MEFYFPLPDIIKLRTLFENSSNILIISHTNPDGDAIGSVKAIKNYLKSKGLDAKIAVPNDCPDYLQFMDSTGEIMVWRRNSRKVKEAVAKCDLMILADFNNLSRVDEMESCLKNSSAVKVLIDHHPSPQENTFDLIFSETTLSSTCEALYWIFLGLEGERQKKGFAESNQSLDLATCESLYVGLITDTNNYSNSAVSSTFRMASDLLALGVDKEKIQHLVFGGFSENRMRLMGHLLLNKIVLLPQFGAGYILLSASEQSKFGFTDGDSEGFVNMPLNIKGINISALFTENDSHIRVSLRSVNDFSVNSLAQRFYNGGGHERAAGGKLFIPLRDVPEYFESSLMNFLKEGRSDENDK